MSSDCAGFCGGFEGETSSPVVGCLDLLNVLFGMDPKCLAPLSGSSLSSAAEVINSQSEAAA